jgi:competence protein ComEC
LRALGPPADIPEEGPANEYSLVLRADIEGLTILFTGDIEEEGQGFLLSEPAMLHADILKIPHHGGFAETGEKFFAAVRASVAVISVGRDNSYGHPSRGTLESLDRCGCSIYRTDLNGDVVIEGLPHCLEVKCDKSGESCGLGYKWPIAA